MQLRHGRRPRRRFLVPALLSLCLWASGALAAPPEGARDGTREGVADAEPEEPAATVPPEGDAAPGEADRAEEDAGDAETGGDEAQVVIPVGEIQVTATRGERDVLDVPGNVTIIDRETIEASGARDLPDLLRREAGVFVTNSSTNRAGYDVEARGFNNGGGNGGRTLVLVDGRRVNEPNGGRADWAFVPLDNVDSVEIVRGPVNALYGDNAVAGVIHVRTRRPPRRGVDAAVHGRTGTYDTDEGSLWFGAGAGPVSASVFLDGHKTHGYRERSDLRARRAEAQVIFDLWSRGDLRLAGGYDSQTRQFPGTLTRAEMAEDRRQAAPGSLDDFSEPRERWGQLELDFALAEQVTFHTNAWHRRRNDRSQVSDPFFVFSLEREVDANSVESWLEVDVEVFGRRSRTLVGGSYLQEDVDSNSTLELPPFLPTTARDHARRKLYGAFLQEELNLTDDLLLVLGVRRESARYDGVEAISGQEFRLKQDEWAPKAALSWRVIEPLSVYASWARGFRFPNFDEAFGFFGFSPGLEPEISKSYEVGGKWQSERATVNLAAYYTNVDHEIFFDPLAPNALVPTLFATNVNIDRVRHRGVEFFASVRPWPWLELYGSYTYDDVKFARDSLTGLEGFRMPITPRHRGNAGVRTFLPYGFEVGLNANYVGSRFLTNDVTNSLEKLPRWASYDLRVAWRRTLVEGLEVTVDAVAYNVTNRRYTELGGVSTFSPRVGYYPSPDRHYMAGVSVEYRR